MTLLTCPKIDYRLTYLQLPSLVRQHPAHSISNEIERVVVIFAEFS